MTPQEQSFLNTLRSNLDKSVLSKEDFITAFKEVIALITKIEGQLISKVNGKISDTSSETEKMRQMMSEMRSQFEQAIRDTKKSNDSTFAGIKQRSIESMQEMFRKMDVQGQMDSMMKECDVKMAQIPTMDSILKAIPEDPEETAEEIANKLETLQGDERLTISAIKDLQEKLDELKQQFGKGTQIFGGGLSRGVADGLYAPIGSTGAGTSIYNEVVAGDVQTFTLLHTPTTDTLRVYARGQRILPTSGFTLTGAIISTIDTFTTGDLYADYQYV